MFKQIVREWNEKPDTAPEIDIIDSKLEGGNLILTKRVKSCMMYATHPPRPKPDTVWKEVYCSHNNGDIYLYDIIEGKHEPERFIKERFVFEK